MVNKDLSKSDSMDISISNPELVNLYQKNANVGSENLGGASPLLKIHSTGRSNTNFLVNGKEPNDGWFFYKSTREQFETIECHILSISRGFRVDGLNKKAVYNQILGGVFFSEGKMLPFITYFTGKKLSNMWEFGKEASQYTKAKPVAIPIFALKVKLTTEKVTVEYEPGKKTGVWLVNFEIIKDEKDRPIIVKDVAEFNVLRANVDSVNKIINSIIEIKEPEEFLDQGLVPASDEDHSEDIPPEEMPI